MVMFDAPSVLPALLTPFARDVLGSLELGVIVQPTGDGNNVLKVKPPLCITPASADVVAEALEIALRGW